MKNAFTAMLIGVMPLSALAARNQTIFTIAAYGDSTTAGVISSGGKNIIARDNEMTHLLTLLQAQYGPGVQLKNYGVPGAQAAELLYGKKKQQGSAGSWAQRMAASNADIILINYAINDALHYYFKDKHVHQESPQEYKRIITELVKMAKQHNKRVVLQESNPLCGRAERWNVYPYVYQLNQVAKEQNVPVVKQYARIKAMKGWQKQMSPDCIHPSETLYKDKAQETFNVITKNFAGAFLYTQINSLF